MRRRLLLALALSLVALPASAQNFSNTIFFGDSNTDSGRYLYVSPLGVTCPAPFCATQGGYTTNPGPMWSVALGARFGVVVTPSDAPGGGNNYAAGGARVVFVNPVTPGVWSTAQQIAAYLASAGGVADPNALYTYYIGINDLKSTTVGGPGNIVNPPNNAAIITLAQQAIGQVTTLAAAGARYILIPNTISTLTPAAAAAGGFVFSINVRDSRALYDQTVWNGLAANGIRFIPADFNTVWNYVITNPLPFGITVTNINTPACGPITASINCGPANYVTPNADKTYFFADGPLSSTGGGHLTTAMQQIEADYYYSLIVAPSEISFLGVTAVQTGKFSIAGIQGQIQSSWQNLGPGGFNSWVSGDVSSLKVSNYHGFPGDPNVPVNGSAGFDQKHANGWMTGFALTVGALRSNFDLGGNFTQEAAAASVYAARKDGMYWYDVVGSIGYLHYDVNRTVPIGITQQSNHGTTNGISLALAGEAGYDFKVGKGVTVAPVVGLVMQQIHISGFTESGSFTSLGFGSQTRNSAVTELGLRLKMDYGVFQPFAKATWDHELASPGFVTASLTTITAPSYSMPAVIGGKDWANVTVGTEIQLRKDLKGMIAFTAQLGDSNVVTYGGRFGLNMAY